MIKEKLQQDIKEALKAGNSDKRTTLGLVMSAIKNKELEKRTKLSKSGVESDKLESESALTDEEVMKHVSEFDERGFQDMPPWLQQEMQVRGYTFGPRPPTKQERI